MKNKIIKIAKGIWFLLAGLGKLSFIVSLLFILTLTWSYLEKFGVNKPLLIFVAITSCIFIMDCSIKLALKDIKKNTKAR